MSDASIFTIAGVEAGGVAAGIKKTGRPDLALLRFAPGTRWTATVTKHALRAAPVRRLEAQLAGQPRPALRAIVVNAGNANACTGEGGVQAARRTAEAAATLVGCAADEVIVSSTGVIGVPLPVERIEAALPAAAAACAAAGWGAAGDAIRTTDAWPKISHRPICDADGAVVGVVGGIAKGAGMIAPNMATMLCYLATDLRLDDAQLDAALQGAVRDSFNIAIVDGDQSTNDTVVLAATGASPAVVGDATLAAFRAALGEVCAELARSIVRDGEGARRLADIVVEGAPDDEAAQRMARAIGTSPLVKTALYGGDPNWGRIAAAAGSIGVPIREDELTVELGGVAMFEQGAPRPEREAAAAAAMQAEEVVIRVVVGRGRGRGRIWASDLGHEYVTCNADYRS